MCFLNEQSDADAVQVTYSHPIPLSLSCFLPSSLLAQLTGSDA